jgi:hypothetical protein
LSTETDQIAELAGTVSEIQESIRKSAAVPGLPVLDMSQMMNARDYHKLKMAARNPSPQPRSAQPQRLAGSVVPRSFSFTLSVPNADLESEVRRDIDFQVESAKYAKAAEQWWAALSHGDRRAIDYAGMELIARHTAATGAVYGVAIRGYKGEIARLQALVEHQKAQVTRLEQETRDHKQRADAMEIAHMTERPAIPAPDVHVTVALPDEIGVRLAPSAGVAVDYDDEGRVIGTRPRELGQ